MNKGKIKKAILSIAAACMVAMGGCADDNVITGAGMMVKTGSVNVEGVVSYTNESSIDILIDSFISDDGLCSIKKYSSYYDVTLDYEKGTPAQVGSAYADTVRQAVPDYEIVMEPYLYENIRCAFGGRSVNYTALEDRIRTLFGAIPEEYRQEIDAFALAFSQGREGYAEDGQLSYIEVLTMQMIPDALRPTACSALSLGGSRTESGERITLRNLEWNLGSQAQITKVHAVTHMKKHDCSHTDISMLGILDIITAVNDDGVMIAILDIGSDTAAREGLPFVYEGKKCYTFEIRYALEHFDNARDAGEFLVAESGDFTWCNNLLVTDSKDAFCCENATSETVAAKRAVSVLRTVDSELMEGLSWDSADSLCIVNSFATKGNMDGFTASDANLDRFMKYNKWVSAKEKFSVADVKAVMAQEIVDQHEVINVHNSGTIHTVILDYETGDIHVAFTKGFCADDVPEYLNVGRYCK